VARPAVTSVSPSTGTTAGGTTVTIGGTGFTGASTVSFGTDAGSDVTLVSSTEITVVSPAHAAGKVTVKVTTPAGASRAVTGDRYTNT
jgi:IPT/TIG domain